MHIHISSQTHECKKKSIFNQYLEIRGRLQLSSQMKVRIVTLITSNVTQYNQKFWMILATKTSIYFI